MGLVSDARRALQLYDHDDFANLKLVVWIKAQDLGIITRYENVDPYLDIPERFQRWEELVQHAMNWLDIPEEEKWQWEDKRSLDSKYGLLSRMMQKWMRDKMREKRVKIWNERNKSKEG